MPQSLYRNIKTYPPGQGRRDPARRAWLRRAGGLAASLLWRATGARAAAAPVNPDQPAESEGAAAAGQSAPPGATGRQLATGGAQPAWNAAAFSALGEAEVLAALGLHATPRLDARVRFEAPEIAESGAVVPVEVVSDVPTTRRVVLLALRNPNTLVADFQFGSRLLPQVATRIKLAETTEVVALVQSDEGLFAARRLVKVTLGGCGG